MPDNEYACLDCGAEFATPEAMNDHIDSHHNEGYGEAETPKAEGGFDGLVLSFGDGTDIDTINGLLPNWRVEFTMRNGEKFDGEIVGAGTGDATDEAFIEFHPVNDADEVIHGDIQAVLFDDVVGIHIY